MVNNINNENRNNERPAEGGGAPFAVVISGFLGLLSSQMRRVLSQAKQEEALQTSLMFVDNAQTQMAQTQIDPRLSIEKQSDVMQARMTESILCQNQSSKVSNQFNQAQAGANVIESSASTSAFILKKLIKAWTATAVTRA